MAAPIFLAAKAAASAVAKKAAQRAAVQQAAKTAVKAAAARRGARGGADSERNEKDGKRSIAMLFVGLLAVVVVLAGSIVNGTIVGLASVVTPGYTDIDVCQLFPEYGGEDDPIDDEPDHDHDHDEDGEEGAGDEDSGGDDPPESDSAEGVIFPLPMDGSWRLTSKYGPRNIGGGASRYHRGTDFGAPRGTYIFAPLDGRVVAMGTEGNRGKLIRIRHTFNGDTFETLSQHLDGWASGIKVGSKVQAGQVVAYVGNTGLSIGRGGGYHLHFELWTVPGKWDSTVDPMPWFKSNGAKGLGKPIVPDPGMEDVYGEEWNDFAEVCELDPPDNGGGPLDTYENGKIPEDMLASPEFNKKVLLNPKAAIALEKMNKAYKEQFGIDLRIVASYRSLADQEACKEEKTDVPTLTGLCPAPGKDPFGMGRMIEVGGKAADKDSAENAWLVENAATYKWKQFSATSSPHWWKYTG